MYCTIYTNLTFFQAPPFVYLDTDHRKLLNGLDVKIINSIMEILNFTYHIVDCNLIWGVKLENNTWNGIIGMLHRNVINILLL